MSFAIHSLLTFNLSRQTTIFEAPQRNLFRKNADLRSNSIAQITAAVQKAG